MTEMKPLTKRQKEVFAYIKSFISTRGYSPSLREIGDAIGASSSSTTKGFVDQLIARGYLANDPDKPRSLRIVGAADDTAELKRRIIELEEAVNIVTMGSESESVQMLGALLSDRTEENKKLRFAATSVLGIVKEMNGEPARQIRDILSNMFEEIGEEADDVDEH